MSEITHNDVQFFLEKTSLDLFPGQNAISFPIIQRIHRRLLMGKRFDPIKVTSDGIICDGHHRYICLSILGIEIETIAGGKSLSAYEEFKWGNIKLESNDYDSPEEIINYQKKYG
jgi:hypothetical protein